MSEFDAVVLGESRNLYKIHRDALLARYKTEEAAVAGVRGAIYKVLQKYEGTTMTPSVRTALQVDIERSLRSMLTN